MTTKCEECKGEGEYEIQNAYDNNYRKLVTCEYCKGSGLVHYSPRYGFPK